MIDSISFFAASDSLDYLVLRPLSHIKPNWELSWGGEDELYMVEEDSFAADLNQLIKDLSFIEVNPNYHLHEDLVAEYQLAKSNWQIKKNGRLWIGHDYQSILEQGGFHDDNQKDLLRASVGRIQAAIKLNQLHFDQMETNHQKMLAGLLSIILFHRWNQK